MLKKIIVSAILVMGMAFCLPFTSFCESTADHVLSTFELGAENKEVITTSVNAAYTHIRDYGSTVSPITLENDLFRQAYPYQCYGGGSNNRWDNIYKMKFDIPDAGANDCVWLSYYYKSESSFVGGNGNTYKGTTIDVPQQRNTANEIVVNLKAGAYGDTFVADDQWHRVDLYMSAANIKNEELLIYFTDMSKPVSVLFAGFRAGVVHFPEGVTYNNDRAYTELGWHLQNKDADAILLNGKTVALSDGIYEYNISADTDALDVALPDGAKVKVAQVEKKSVGAYEVLLAAPGYSPSGEKSAFRRRVNSATGEFSQNGTIETYTVENAAMLQKYTINLELKAVEAAMTVDGANTTSLDGCVGGETIAVNVKYRNLKAENKTYMTVLMICKDNAVQSIMPAREIISDEIKEFENTYPYTLPVGDYTGCVADFLVIDTGSMCDGAK